jgi:hypothetical protein
MNVNNRSMAMVSGIATAVVAAVIATSVGIAHIASAHTRSHSIAATTANRAVAWKAIPAAKELKVVADDECSAGTLTAQQRGEGGVAMGRFQTFIRITNHSDKTCALSALSLTRTTDPGTATLASSGDDHPITVDAEGITEVNVSLSERCLKHGGGDATESLALAWGAETLSVAMNNLPMLTEDCVRGSLNQSHVPAGIDAGDGPLAGLHVSVNAPESGSGSTINFQATITNSGSVEYKFDECPTYTERTWLYDSEKPGSQGSASRTYRLNCDAADPIPSHGSETFSMQAPVPAGSGLLKVGWFWGDDGPSDVAVVNDYKNP